jgi:hypothetical protein
MLGIWNRSARLLFDNDRLSHRFAGAVLSWLAMFLLWGLLIFHLWLRVPTAKVAMFTAICCAVQLGVTPWLCGQGHTSEPKWSGCPACRSGDRFVLGDDTAFFITSGRAGPTTSKFGVSEPETISYALMSLGSTWLLTERYDDGISFFSEYISRYPEDSAAYCQRACALWYTTISGCRSRLLPCSRIEAERHLGSFWSRPGSCGSG